MSSLDYIIPWVEQFYSNSPSWNWYC